MEQEKLYRPIRNWLESKGFRVLVTGGDEHQVVIPIGDILPTRVHMVPDIVGIKEDDAKATIVEVETDLHKLVEVIGKCMILKTVATLVYVAYPLEKCKRWRALEKLGLGLLGVSEREVREIIKIMPMGPGELFKVLELHPLDFSKERELIRLVRGILDSAELEA